MKIYLVGGAVRDELLSIPVKDRDYVVVGATEQQMLDLGFRRMDVAFPVFLHPDTGDEYALARRERKTGPGYRGFEVEVGADVSLEQDLIRRDLTINALARDASGNIIDLFHGRDDLEQGMLRHISPAFSEDPVRLLRAARFAAKLGRHGFRLGHKTSKLMKDMAGLDELNTVYPDRLREEMLKALRSDQPWRFFETLQRCGALRPLLPELADGMDADDAHQAEWVGEPMAVLRRITDLSDSPPLRYAALLATLFDDAKKAAAFGAGLRMDGASREQAAWLLDWPANRVRTSDAEYLCGMIGKLKLTHHSGRLETLQQGWAAVDPGNAQSAVERLNRALSAMSDITAESLKAEGLEGPELGKALRDRRLQAVSQRLR